MENQKPETISYYDHEVQVARSEIHARRWAIAALIMFVALILTNAGWMWYENQFADEITVTQDTPGGNNNYIGRDGDITNGTANGN